MHSVKRLIPVLLTLVITITITLAMASPVSAQQGAEIRVTDSEAEADQPDVAVDSKGNVHIAYCDSYDTSTYEIWYTMLDNNGNTLIDATLITLDDNEKSRRPAIVVDSEDKVHIIWQDDMTWGLFYTKLDPSLDDQDGDAAGPAAITLVDDKEVANFGGPGDEAGAHARIAVDSKDDIHIVCESTSDYDAIYYLKIDNDGNELVAPQVIRQTSHDNVWRASPDVAVDSDNNAHITWNDIDESMLYETYYMMLDGSNGSTLIDATRITPDDGRNSKRQSIVVDFEGRVHIIWADQRGEDQQIYYTKLDPSLDDQDGDSADELAITLIDDTALTPDYGVSRNHPTSAIHCGHYIHIT